MRTRSQLFPRRGGERGSALIGVFWLMAVLSLAVFTTAHLVNNDMDIIISQKQSFRAGQLAEMGIAIGMNPVIEKGDPLLVQEFDGAEAFEVRLRSEGGRLNINTLLAKKDRLLLEGVFIFWGLSEEEASEIMDALLDWVDSDDLEELTGAEFEYYYELGYENYPFNRPFYDIEEMALVRGMDLVSEYKPDWRDYFTLWSSGSINVNEASAEMLEMVGEVSPEAAGQFVRVRNGLDLYPDTEDDVVYQNVAEALAVLGIPELSPAIGRFSVSDATMRVESTGIVGDYLKTVVLVVRNRDTRPEILARDELFYR